MKLTALLDESIKTGKPIFNETSTGGLIYDDRIGCFAYCNDDGISLKHPVAFNKIMLSNETWYLKDKIFEIGDIVEFDKDKVLDTLKNECSCSCDKIIDIDSQGIVYDVIKDYEGNIDYIIELSPNNIRLKVNKNDIEKYSIKNLEDMYGSTDIK